MKYFISIGIILLSSFSTFTKAQANKTSNKVEIKCHIELLGGGETIHFANIPEVSLKQYVKSLQHRKIIVNDSKNKAKVYKVFECINANSDFTNSRAKSLEENTLR